MIKPADISLERLRQIGWQVWDPIGLAYPDGTADEGCVDEYDRYLIHVANLLIQGGRSEDAVAYLNNIAAEDMGLGKMTLRGNEASHKTVAAIAAYLRETSN